jgi:hypothetical protein
LSAAFEALFRAVLSSAVRCGTHDGGGFAWAVWASDWSDAAAVLRDVWARDVSVPADRSVPSVEAADWTCPMSVMTASVWLWPPLFRHEMASLAQPDGDAVATDEGAADRLDVAALFPVDDE